MMPLTLFNPLWYASGPASAYILAVTTGLFGIIIGLEWVYKTRQLWKKKEVRPFGGKRNGVRLSHKIGKSRWEIDRATVRFFPHKLLYGL